MKRILTVTLLGLTGTAAVAAVTPVRDLPAVLAGWNAAADRATALNALEQLGRSQREATDDVVARLTDGRSTLAEAVALLESNTQGRPVFRDQLAVAHPEGTDRERLAGYALGRAKDRLENDPGQMSALLARLNAEAK